MELLEYVIKMQSIAKIGKLFSTDLYALENYEMIEKLSREMLEKLNNEKLDRINYFERDIYPTPNIGVRVVIVEDNKLLMVKEIKEQKYSLPGGWCDVFEGIKDNAKAEVLQEAGFEVEIGRLLAIFNHNSKLAFVKSISEYSVYVEAKIVAGQAKTSHETDEVKFVELDKITNLSFKNTKEEIEIALDIYLNNKEVYFE